MKLNKPQSKIAVLLLACFLVAAAMPRANAWGPSNWAQNMAICGQPTTGLIISGELAYVSTDSPFYEYGHVWMGAAVIADDKSWASEVGVGYGVIFGMFTSINIYYSHWEPTFRDSHMFSLTVENGQTFHLATSKNGNTWYAYYNVGNGWALMDSWTPSINTGVGEARATLESYYNFNDNPATFISQWYGLQTFYGNTWHSTDWTNLLIESEFDFNVYSTIAWDNMYSRQGY